MNSQKLLTDYLFIPWESKQTTLRKAMAIQPFYEQILSQRRQHIAKYDPKFIHGLYPCGNSVKEKLNTETCFFCHSTDELCIHQQQREWDRIPPQIDLLENSFLQCNTMTPKVFSPITQSIIQLYVSDKLLSKLSLKFINNLSLLRLYQWIWPFCRRPNLNTLAVSTTLKTTTFYRL